jgi:hypothetical protein
VKGPLSCNNFLAISSWPQYIPDLGNHSECNTMSADAKDLKDKARTARDAVTDLEEPLKTEAFKIFLAQLLSEGGTEKRRALRTDIAPPRLPTRAKSGGAKKKREDHASVAESSLKLDVAALKRLGSYCARFDLQGGTEQIAFILVNFAREHTDLKFVTDADIAWLHRQLISLRIKVEPVNKASHWTRALRWLTAPSRRKEWLERSGDGYVVSNSGLVHWHELEEEAKSRQGSANGPKGK